MAVGVAVLQPDRVAGESSGDCVPMALVPGLSGQRQTRLPFRQCTLSDGSRGVLTAPLDLTLLDGLSRRANIADFSPIGVEDREDVFHSPEHENRLKRSISVKKADETLMEQDKLEKKLREKGGQPEPGSSAHMSALNGEAAEVHHTRARLAARAMLALCNCHNYTESAARAAATGRRRKREPVCQRLEQCRNKRQLTSPTATIPDCEPEPRPSCVKGYRFRSISGVCNNLQNRFWGRAGNALRRLVENTYDDELFSPRTQTVSGCSLPSARTVTALLIRNKDAECTHQSSFSSVFGQFISHDISHTPFFIMTDLPLHERQKLGNSRFIPCCPSHGTVFPDPPVHPQCNPIEIDEGDHFYKKHAQRCMQMVRSLAAPDPECIPRPMQQMNALSPYLDLSTVYSSDDTLADQLRAHQGGLLRDNGGLLPPRKSSPHKRSVPDADWAAPWHGKDKYSKDVFHHSGPMNPVNTSCGTGCVGCICYQAGDARVNEQPTLTMMHTIWMREHNRIARILHERHPKWNDERLYQETRRVVIAEYQHILYNEYLPVLLGYNYCDKHALLPLSGDRFSQFYRSDIRVDVATEFSTAAFRMGHSQVQDIIKLVSKLGQRSNVEITNGYFDPKLVSSKKEILSEMVRGLLDQPSEQIDAEFDESVYGFLFKNRFGKRPYGMDLAALNIHRGRDHGIGTYTQLATHCLQQSFGTWSSLRKVMPADAVQRLQQVYDDPQDVDLFIGGLLETHADGAKVGPTFQCIIADTFFRLRFGDRFFYDNRDMAHSFTAAQLAQVRRASMARVFCDNLDAFPTVPALTMLQARRGFNQPELCDSLAIPRVDLSQFWT